MDIGSFTWFIGLMILMTGDRFFTVLYPLRYPVYWTDIKARISIGSLIFFSLTYALIYTFLPMEKKTRSLVRAYYWMTFLIIFLTIVICTYSYIINRISRISRIDVAPVAASNNNNSSNTNNARSQSRFRRSLIVPSLIIGTFILLWAVPFVISFIGNYVNLGIPAEVWQFSILIFGIGFILDAVTYIFLQPSMRRIIIRMVRGRRVGDEETTRATSMATNTTKWTIILQRYVFLNNGFEW